MLSVVIMFLDDVLVERSSKEDVRFTTSVVLKSSLEETGSAVGEMCAVVLSSVIRTSVFGEFSSQVVAEKFVGRLFVVADNPVLVDVSVEMIPVGVDDVAASVSVVVVVIVNSLVVSCIGLVDA